ncbi:MAG: formylglycine-generating enzyme family protein [Spirochaetaceae bacterium]|nr:formylglycine-generating enzyme family protein [Spirochaetaceae bacterium]
MRRALITVAALCSLALVTWPVAADLDPAIQADLHLVQAEDFIKEKNYVAAQEAMKKILVLQEKHDLKIPTEFHFKYAQVLELAGHYEEAVAAVTEYLKIAGRGGVHYREALSLLHTATQGLQPPAVGEQFRDCAECPEMVVVPAGSYVMGSPSSEEGRWDHEGPQHRVTIGEPFAVGTYEVTFEEWDACVSGGGCGGYAPDARWGRGRRPVANVSWYDAQRYVAWLRHETGEPYRLLSEAEWEYVARAGSSMAHYWGESSSVQCRYENGADQTIKENSSNYTDSDVVSCDDGYYGAAPAGSFSPNGYGLYDALGNVAEWVEDCWNDSYRGAPFDGSAWESGNCSRRVVRGGAWAFGPVGMRSAYRGWDGTGDRPFYAGFRVARTITP